VLISLFFILFGYLDQRPSPMVVSEDLFNQALSKALAPCQAPVEKFCGYALVSPNEWLSDLISSGSVGVADYEELRTLVSTVHSSRQVMGSDRYLRFLVSSDRTSFLLMGQPAFSRRDDLNRRVYLTQQNNLSALMKSVFEQSFKVSGSRIFYLGHSRYGYGPDFSFPFLREQDQFVDRRVYQHRMQRGESAVGFLNPRSVRASKAYFFSCDSEAGFVRALRSRLPGLRLQGTMAPLQPEQALSQMLEAVSEVH
jgi:hypothetical protein